MKYILGKEKYLKCKENTKNDTAFYRHRIESCEALLDKKGNVKKVIYGCISCGVRYDNDEEIKKDNEELDGE